MQKTLKEQYKQLHIDYKEYLRLNKPGSTGEQLVLANNLISNCIDLIDLMSKEIPVEKLLEDKT